MKDHPMNSSRQRCITAGVLLLTLLSANAAHALDGGTEFDFITMVLFARFVFTPVGLFLLAMRYLCTRMTGAQAVYRVRQENGRPAFSKGAAILAVIFCVALSGIAMLVFMVFNAARAIRMMAWAVQAKSANPSPPGLEGVIPARMAAGAGVLFLTSCLPLLVLFG